MWMNWGWIRRDETILGLNVKIWNGEEFMTWEDGDRVKNMSVCMGMAFKIIYI